jgi:hypothetical protein
MWRGVKYGHSCGADGAVVSVLAGLVDQEAAILARTRRLGGHGGPKQVVGNVIGTEKELARALGHKHTQSRRTQAIGVDPASGAQERDGPRNSALCDSCVLRQRGLSSRRLEKQAQARTRHLIAEQGQESVCRSRRHQTVSSLYAN